jgi:hypothetical protein
MEIDLKLDKITVFVVRHAASCVMNLIAPGGLKMF